MPISRTTIDGLRSAGRALAARVVAARVVVCAAALIGSVVALSGCGGADDARLTTFAGHWHGDARGLDILRSGLGKEHIGSSARPIVTLTFEVLRVAGASGVAKARIQVTSVRLANTRTFFGLLPYKGEFGTLQLRRGIITDSTTRVVYCAPAIDECDPPTGPDADDANTA